MRSFLFVSSDLHYASVKENESGSHELLQETFQALD